MSVEKWSHWHWHHRLFFQHICLVLLSCTMTLPYLAGTSSHTSSASSRTLDSKLWKIRLVLLHRKCIHITIVTENVCPVHADWFKKIISLLDICLAEWHLVWTCFAFCMTRKAARWSLYTFLFDPYRHETHNLKSKHLWWPPTPIPHQKVTNRIVPGGKWDINKVDYWQFTWQ